MHVAHIAWNEGGTATIDAVDGEKLELTSTRAFAPGSRPEGRLHREPSTLPGHGQRVWLKVHGSRQNDDGSFRVAGRLLDATRELRTLLKEASAPTIGGKKPES